MINEDVLLALLVLCAAAQFVCAGMLAGIRDMLANIDYDLCEANMRELYRSQAPDTMDFDA